MEAVTASCCCSSPCVVVPWKLNKCSVDSATTDILCFQKRLNPAEISVLRDAEGLIVFVKLNVNTGFRIGLKVVSFNATL
jgi:hypothetical protein